MRSRRPVTYRDAKTLAEYRRKRGPYWPMTPHPTEGWAPWSREMRRDIRDLNRILNAHGLDRKCRHYKGRTTR